MYFEEADDGMAGAVEQESIFLSDLGRRVRHARTVRGLSRKLLSQTSGLSERYIAQLESGQGNVSIILLRRVANAMGVRLDDLIAGQDTQPDWQVIRDLLVNASPEQVTLAKGILSGQSSAGSETPQPRVAVIGLRGAGKSTLGRRVADRLGWTFVELNAEIERENALSVKEIFAIYGQEGYRRLEQAALRRLTEHPGPLVLATGGGIVAEPLTYDLLLQAFFTIWLRARPRSTCSGCATRATSPPRVTIPRRCRSCGRCSPAASPSMPAPRPWWTPPTSPSRSWSTAWPRRSRPASATWTIGAAPDSIDPAGQGPGLGRRRRAPRAQGLAPRCGEPGPRRPTLADAPSETEPLRRAAHGGRLFTGGKALSTDRCSASGCVRSDEPGPKR